MAFVSYVVKLLTSPFPVSGGVVNDINTVNSIKEDLVKFQ